jgi:prophage antirepressor-like protein
MSNELLQVFNFNEATVRIIEKQGEVWFVAADVAEVLGFQSASLMNRMLDEDEKGVHLVYTHGGTQQMTVINEPGLYSILNKSTKETVKTFQKWVNHEVLPAIRKTGHYASRKASRPELEASIIFKAYHCIAKLIGLDKNQCALSANNAAKSITGTDALKLMGVTHLLAEVQEVLLTPTEIGKEIEKLQENPLTAVKVNKQLETMGFQIKSAEKWEPTDTGRPFSRLFDTGKKHSSGVPVTQLKWYKSVIPEIINRMRNEY